MAKVEKNPTQCACLMTPLAAEGAPSHLMGSRHPRPEEGKRGEKGNMKVSRSTTIPGMTMTSVCGIPQPAPGRTRDAGGEAIPMGED